MFNILIDTSVWLDLAEDAKQTPLLSVIEEMIKAGLVTLILPDIVVHEFKANRDRVAKASVKSLSSHFNLVKDAVRKVGGDKRRTDAVLSHLNDVNHKIPIVGGAAEHTLTRIEKIFESSQIVRPADDVVLRAAQRAIKKLAPFHSGKNSMADAVLMETYLAAASAKSSAGQRFAFVTHNTSDFSVVQGNRKLSHIDWGATAFSRIKSLYFINLAEALRRVEPSFVSELLWEQSWNQEPRSLTEMLREEDKLTMQVWYNRHWVRREKIEAGKIKIVEKETDAQLRSRREATIQKDIWAGALKSAKAVEKRYGKQNLGPWTDFEWGMVNGKLSAIRWMLGDEWDMLDT
ncbi:PIN domain-containing protein [Rugamonas sp.]|uniref:PIN domain-containing protein n=1 Tax=Rugamonas sp. TaxID=1926287 RepID=UPI0025E6F144|nr:PIN domain-containing protein [Rugamonas sp.]